MSLMESSADLWKGLKEVKRRNKCCKCISKIKKKIKIVRLLAKKKFTVFITTAELWMTFGVVLAHLTKYHKKLQSNADGNNSDK